MSNANFDDGKTASTKMQVFIMSLLDEGLDPGTIGLVTCSIGTAMMIQHYGEKKSQELCAGLMREAVAGNLPVYSALNTANRNRSGDSTD